MSNDQDSRTPFERFEDLTKRLLGVQKAEINEQAAHSKGQDGASKDHERAVKKHARHDQH